MKERDAVEGGGGRTGTTERESLVEGECERGGGESVRERGRGEKERERERDSNCRIASWPILINDCSFYRIEWMRLCGFSTRSLTTSGFLTLQ